MIFDELNRQDEAIVPSTSRLRDQHDNRYGPTGLLLWCTEQLLIVIQKSQDHDGDRYQARRVMVHRSQVVDMNLTLHDSFNRFIVVSVSFWR
jgi:hypothetical protein